MVKVTGNENVKIVFVRLHQNRINLGHTKIKVIIVPFYTLSNTFHQRKNASLL